MTAPITASNLWKYYQSQVTVNPSRIVAGGPDIDFAAPHNRARLKVA